MSTNLIIELVKSIPIAVGIGLAFFIVPFGLLILARITPWLIVKMLIKFPLIWNIFIKNPEYTLDKFRHDKQPQIDECDPTQIMRNLRRDGIQSLFGNYSPSVRPIRPPDNLTDKSTPKYFIKSTNPKPVKEISKESFNQLTHADKSITSEDISTTLIDKNRQGYNLVRFTLFSENPVWIL